MTTYYIPIMTSSTLANAILAEQPKEAQVSKPQAPAVTRQPRYVLQSQIGCGYMESGTGIKVTVNEGESTHLQVKRDNEVIVDATLTYHADYPKVATGTTFNAPEGGWVEYSVRSGYGYGLQFEKHLDKYMMCHTYNYKESCAIPFYLETNTKKALAEKAAKEATEKRIKNLTEALLREDDNVIEEGLLRAKAVKSQPKKV